MEQFIESYQLIKNKIPLTFRSKLRELFLNSLAAKNSILGINEYLDIPRIQFLYIHHSFKDELVNLDRLLNNLSKNFTFISYSDAVNLILQNKIDKPYISISSDDGFKNNLFAAEVLNKYNIKACFFINPGLIDEKNYDKIKEHCAIKLHMPPIEFLSWKEVEHLQSNGHEIGAHTMFHDNVASLTSEQLKADLAACYNSIMIQCGEIRHFAFPYGRFHDFNAIGREAVFENGFISCASAERGCHINISNQLNNSELCIRRDHIILDWPMEHVNYFLVNNVKKWNQMNNYFPY
ncbi:MAG: polysaccharide deacetylase family protein [bacterium]|nr:polysaccharide deacetylase family protein [bacterium]